MDFNPVRILWNANKYIKKKQQTTELTSRLKKILKSNLHRKSLMKAINMHIISSLTYSYGIIPSS